MSEILIKKLLPHSLTSWVVRFLLVQTFVTLISLPILIGWGLPLSLVAPLGNLLFSPLLGLYLVCALMVFFTELIGLPNSLCTWALEWVSSIWLWSLNLLEHSVQVGFTQPHYFLLTTIPLAACTLVWYLRRRAPHITLVWLSTLLGCACVILYATRQSRAHFTLERDGAQVTCIIDGGNVALIDTDGAFSRKTAAEEWIIYHLIPAITAQTGATQIDHCLLVHPRQRTFEAITALCSRMQIGSIYIPKWEGKLKYPAWKSYCHMRDAVKDAGGKIVVCERAVSIALSSASTLLYAPTDMYNTYHDARYPIFELKHNSIDTA
jgi:hypothetical protein